MSAYEGGQNHLPDIPAERWREMYMEAAGELERLRADLARAEADARRYRWLRDSASIAWPSVDLGNAARRAERVGDGSLVDAEVDKQLTFYAAIAAQGADHE